MNASGASAVAALVLLFAPCITLAQGAAPAPAVQDDKPSIIVTGTAMKSVPADLAVISLGVTTSDKAVKPAADENAKLMAQVLAALEKVGVAKDDMATGQFSINQQFDYSSNSSHPKPTGYQVVNTLTIKSRRLDLTPQIIDAATAAGANRVDSVVFTLALPEQHRSLALADAVQSAGADAQRVAEAAGVKLGPVRRMVVGGGAADGPRPMFKGRAMDMAAADASAPTSLTPGTIEITATVTIEYDIAP